MTLIPPEICNGLIYDQATGELRWTKKGNRRALDRQAGTINARGYWTLSYFKKKLLAHRVIWFLMTGQQPPLLIDHMDGNPLNNAWANLRAADSSLNAANAKPRKRSMSKGVTFNGRRYIAQIGVNGRIIRLGTFGTEKEASGAYARAAVHYFGEFARAA